MHNNYTVYINIGTYRNRDELHADALNASIELYKALYTLCPEKFGSTLFGKYPKGLALLFSYLQRDSLNNILIFGNIFFIMY